MKKILYFFSAAVLALGLASCAKDAKDELPSAAGITPVVKVEGNVATFSLPAGTAGLIPVWYTNETGDFAFAGSGDGFSKTFFEGGTFKVRMYVSNAKGQSADYSEAEFTVEGAAGFNGFKYDSEFNLWKAAAGAASNSYTWHNPGWAAEKALPLTISGSTFSLSVADACSDRWQAQVHLVPDTELALSSDKEYDFSVIVNVSKATGGVTFKLTDLASDDNFLFVEMEDMAEGQNVFYMKGCKGIDAAGVKFVLDFGYSPAGNDITISRIVVKDHANDDGVVAPDKEEKEPDPDPTPNGDANIQVDAATNLWTGATITMANWYSRDDWNGGLTESYNWVKEFSEYSVTIPEEIGGGEWMGQNQFQTNIPISASKSYDFHLVLTSAEACTFTVKLALLGDDVNHAAFYYGALHAEANTPYDFTEGGFSPDIDYSAVTVFVDLGRTPVGTVVNIKDFCLQEHIAK